MLRKLLIRIGTSLLGLAAVLAWWTWGPSSKVGSVKTQASIPVLVGSGGQKLQVDSETSAAAKLRISFEDLSKPVGRQMLLDSWEKIPAGARSWTVDVPAGIGGYIELEAEAPKPGDKLTLRVHVNDKLVDEQSESLDRPLEPNTAFFLQDHFDDYSQAESAQESDNDKSP